MPKFLYALGATFFSLTVVFMYVNSLKVDYSKLESLLYQKEWIKADLYTEEIVDRSLSQAVDGETFFGFSKLDFFRLRRTEILRSRGIPCEELRKIDGLWTKYSNGSFGLTAQAKIALSMRKFLHTLTGNGSDNF